ncbi:hypothetical protein [Natribacillus halophilus]|uniref:Uncharacterized protein n=1 Tax=Natribacillus halophilus TaxID=549003 RepID=A0A1G8RTA5_9BACI|nr:hypothetical protein [Natribacillus halophilus]SDJ20159.1 hypothetical protein SAMN04488123_12035 [Natribacillus halophilus]
MVIAFQIVLIVMMFCAFALAADRRKSKEEKATMAGLTLATMIAFIVSVVWL